MGIAAKTAAFKMYTFIEVLLSIPNTLWALPQICLVLALLQLCPFSQGENSQGQGHEHSRVGTICIVP